MHRVKEVGRMGRLCQVCCRDRPNENFGGKGIRSRVCKRCRRNKSKHEIRVSLVSDEIFGFLSQSNISKKNIKRLESLHDLEDEKFQTLRVFVLAIARAHPRRKKRWRRLKSSHPELFQTALALSLIEDWCEYEDDIDYQLLGLEEQDLIDEVNLQLAAERTPTNVDADDIHLSLLRGHEVPY